MSIQVEEAGLLTTVQDLGRPGYRRFGVTPGGAMDQQAAVLANTLLGNPPSAAVLECTLSGPSLRFLASTWICLTGADMQATCDSQAVPVGQVFHVDAGQLLSLGYTHNGCRGYIAVQGGVEVPQVMGSASTFLRGGFGGYQGRALQQKDQLIIAKTTTRKSLSEGAQVSPSLTEYMDQKNGIRYLPDNDAGVESRQQFEKQSFTVSQAADRMGYRLSGAPVPQWVDREPLSSGVCVGTIQLPADGQPIVLMNDCQTTGGYPLLGQVITVDLAKMAQLKPGDTLQFFPVTLEEAQERLKQQQHDWARLAIAVRYNWR